MDNLDLEAAKKFVKFISDGRITSVEVTTHQLVLVREDGERLVDSKLCCGAGRKTANDAARYIAVCLRLDALDVAALTGMIASRQSVTVTLTEDGHCIEAS